MAEEILPSIEDQRNDGTGTIIDPESVEQPSEPVAVFADHAYTPASHLGWMRNVRVEGGALVADYSPHDGKPVPDLFHFTVAGIADDYETVDGVRIVRKFRLLSVGVTARQPAQPKEAE